MYEILTKNDYLTGASVIIKIPESDLDKKALYTIQADKPEFLIPFSYRSVDGQIEFIYRIGTQSKLQYLSGLRSPKEYAALWSGLLAPLLDCGDWFMKQYSFVLSIDHLYYDREKKMICYIYIPSVQNCSEYSAIKEMAVEFSKHVSVANAELENMVLRAIMKDFNPKDFLQMLDSGIAVDPTPVTLYDPPEKSAVCAPEPVVLDQADISIPEFSQMKMLESAPNVSGDIYINIPLSGKSAKKTKSVADEWNGAPDKKTSKKSKSVWGFLNGKKNERRDMPAGTNVVSQPLVEPVFVPAAVYPTASAFPVCDEPAYPAFPEPIGITQCVSVVTDGSRLRLVGSVLLPPVINVYISEGSVFTIGRFDAVIGRQQSDFEFDKKTKAVSRRHAAIERGEECYMIIDLASSAGTFLDGRKLPPNTPCELGHGCRVSFGNAGADYVWEE